jgi:nucleoside-diphosphate-sugar epimerase
VKAAIITGANGFIGSHILFRLLAQGWHVLALGRSTEAGRWEERVLAALQQVGTVKGLPGLLEFHEVDLRSPEQSLAPAISRGSSATEPILIHVAGDTRFKPADPEAQRRVNVQAPLNLVSALKGRIRRMVHVSTAYVAGKRTGLIRETDLDRGQQFWNSYERSKFDAEIALTQLCREEDVPLVILRPAIIINDRQSGQASTFTHLNALVEVVSRLQDYYGLSDGQVVSKTIRLMADPDARPNLAPVDSIVPPLLQIAESDDAAGKAFHLCHPQPQTNGEIMRLICEAYGVSSQLALEFVERLSAPISHTEEMVVRSLRVYSPYLNSRLEFDVSNSRTIVPDYDSNFSPLDCRLEGKVSQSRTLFSIHWYM